MMSSESTYRITVFFLILSVLFSVRCSYLNSKESLSLGQEEEEEEELIPENIDTTPQLEVAEKKPPEEGGEDTTSFNISSIEEKADKTTDKVGWRIQIFNSNSKKKANKIVAKAQKKLNITVYKKYEPPYYKVRVGNFKKRKKAEKVLQKVREKGFSDAWIVQSEIRNTDE